MSDFNKKCLNIIKDLEKNIKDKETCSYVKSKIIDLMLLYTENVENILERQDSLNKKIDNINERLLNFEDEIFENDCNDDCDCDCLSFNENNDYDFEITCPFCDYSFITDNCTINQKSIKCPRCNEIIELDWSDSNDNCNEQCNNCCNHCYDDKKEEHLLEIKEQEENDNEDDM